MPFLARCSYCQGKVRVPEHALGRSYTCRRCSNCFTLVPAETVQTDTHASAAAPTETSPAATVAASTPVLPAAPAGTSSLADPTEVNLVNLACLFVASLGLLVVSLRGLGWLALGLGLLSLGVSVLRILTDEKKKVLGLAGLGGAAGLLTIVLAVDGLRSAVTPRDFSTTEARVQAAASQEGLTFPCRRKLRLVRSEKDDWVDAGECAVGQDDVYVCVASVKLETPQITHKGAAVQLNESCVVLRLQVMGTKYQREVKFESWGDTTQPLSPDAVLLTTSAGERLASRVFGPGTAVAGHERRPEYYPQMYVDDVLVFVPPRGPVEALRLELSAAAFGSKGKLRLHIPQSLLGR